MSNIFTLAVLAVVVLSAESSSLARIIGGYDVDIDQCPWQASLRRSGSHMCGASIINEQWLVTAAHCVEGQDMTLLTIGYGHKDKTQHMQMKIAAAYMHPEYRPDGAAGYPNDVALLKLEDALTFNDFTDKIDLPKSNNALTNCSITGWGCTSTYFWGGCRSSPNILQKATITKIDLDTCKDLWSDAQIQDVHVCLNENHKSACMGDSGGPLVCTQDGSKVLAGSTSWGSSSCTPGQPSVYARISMFVGWIEETIQKF